MIILESIKDYDSGAEDIKRSAGSVKLNNRSIGSKPKSTKKSHSNRRKSNDASASDLVRSNDLVHTQPEESQGDWDYSSNEDTQLVAGSDVAKQSTKVADNFYLVYCADSVLGPYFATIKAQHGEDVCIRKQAEYLQVLNLNI